MSATRRMFLNAQASGQRDVAQRRRLERNRARRRGGHQLSLSQSRLGVRRGRLRPDGARRRFRSRAARADLHERRRSKNDLEIAGPIKLTLYASSTATDTDFFVKLSDQFPQLPDDRGKATQPGLRGRDPRLAARVAPRARCRTSAPTWCLITPTAIRSR